MADNEANRHAEAEQAAIPQDRPENNQGRYRPENNQGRICYEARIRQIMDTRGCSFEQAQRIIGQMSYEARIRQIMDTGGCSFEQAQRIFGQMCNAARGRRG